MRVAITGATGFLGRYIVNHLLDEGYSCRCWARARSDRGGFVEADGRLEWADGQLGDEAATQKLVAGVDAVVHSALHRPGAGFRGAEGDLIDFVQTNVLGTLGLIMSARAAGVGLPDHDHRGPRPPYARTGPGD